MSILYQLSGIERASKAIVPTLATMTDSHLPPVTLSLSPTQTRLPRKSARPRDWSLWSRVQGNCLPLKARCRLDVGLLSFRLLFSDPHRLSADVFS